MSKRSEREKTGTSQDDVQLEYFKAKQIAGQITSGPDETKKKVIKTHSPSTERNSMSDGYVPEQQHLQNDDHTFERYSEVTFAQKASERAKQNPLIPIGMLGTVAALTLGLRALSRGDRWQSQMMMRARIGAQGFTIFAVLASIMYAGHTAPPTPASSKIERRSTSS